jgi:hypothetical protein
MRYGAFVQLWASRFGGGRVVAFTDSTQFSNFSMFERGKPELLLGMIEWANHRDTFGNLSPALWLGGLGLALAAASMALAWRRPGVASAEPALLLGGAKPGVWVVLLAAGLAGHAGAVLAVNAHNRAAMPLPLVRPDRPYVLVTTDQAVSGGHLPKGGFIAGHEDGFGIFERWILRLGYFTRRGTGADVPESNLVIIINPAKDVPKEYLDNLAAYVNKGGHLLVLDSARNPASTANSVLWPFGAEVRHDQVPLAGVLAMEQPGVLPNTTPLIPISVESACEVRGGSVLAAVAGKPVATCTRFGKGTVTVIGFSSRFCDYSMGVTGDLVPDGPMRTVYELEFRLLEGIIEDKLSSAPPTPPAASRAP